MVAVVLLLLFQLGVATVIIVIILLLSCLNRVLPCCRQLDVVVFSKGGQEIFNVHNDSVRDVHTDTRVYTNVDSEEPKNGFSPPRVKESNYSRWSYCHLCCCCC